MNGQQSRALIEADKAASERPYNADWTPEYRKQIKQRAAKEWDSISEQYKRIGGIGS